VLLRDNGKAKAIDLFLPVVMVYTDAGDTQNLPKHFITLTHPEHLDTKTTFLSPAMYQLLFVKSKSLTLLIR